MQLNPTPAGNGGMHAANRKFLAYWEGLREAGQPPCRNCVNLRQIAGIIPWIVILERSPIPGAFHNRLAGTGITALWGADMTGRDIREPAGSFERDLFAQLFNSALEQGEPFVAQLRIQPRKGTALHAEMLGLPFLTETGEPQLWLSVMAEARMVHAEPIRALQIRATRLLAGETGQRMGTGLTRRLKVIAGGIAD